MSGTTGTPRTQATLLTTEFQDGQPAGSISPQDMRDLITSMPMPNIIRASFRPNFPPYNAKFDGSTNDTAAWSAMFADITSQGWGEVIMPSGTTLIAPATLSVPKDTYIRGQGRETSIIQRFGATTGVLLNASGTASLTGHLGNMAFQDFQINGSGIAGTLMQMYYNTSSFTERVWFQSSNDRAIQIVECWDCKWNEVQVTSCSKNTLATGFTSSGDATGQNIGFEALQILSATAASGFGSSTDSSNQLTFINFLVEDFSCGAIAIATTSFNANSAYQINFYGSKIETGGGPFTGKYIIALGAGCTAVHLENTSMAYISNSGANVGTQQGVLLASGPGNRVKNLFAFANVTGLQSYVKAIAGSAGALVEGITETSGNAPSQAMLWVTGAAPDWSDFTSGTGASLVTPYYAPRFPSQTIYPKGISQVGGAATPGNTLFVNVPNVVYQVTNVTSGTFVQLAAGPANPQSAELTVINSSGSTISVKPQTGGTIAGGATNAAITMTTGTRRTFNSVDALTWY